MGEVVVLFLYVTASGKKHATAMAEELFFRADHLARTTRHNSLKNDKNSC